MFILNLRIQAILAFEIIILMIMRVLNIWIIKIVKQEFILVLIIVMMEALTIQLSLQITDLHALGYLMI